MASLLIFDKGFAVHVVHVKGAYVHDHCALGEIVGGGSAAWLREYYSLQRPNLIAEYRRKMEQEWRGGEGTSGPRLFAHERGTDSARGP